MIRQKTAFVLIVDNLTSKQSCLKTFNIFASENLSSSILINEWVYSLCVHTSALSLFIESLINKVIVLIATQKTLQFKLKALYT